jgi:hypothetical protein
MIEPDIELTLHELAEIHVRHQAPADVREDARLVPLTAPQRRSWLPQFPSWRFPSLLSATKYAVAGVIVTLFGGVLLAGVLMQPRDQSPPGAGASASAAAATLPVMTPVPGVSGWPAVATGDALWVSGSRGYRDGAVSAGSVARVDAATSEVVRIEIPSKPGWLVPTGDAIWAIGSEGVYRVDRTSLSVTDSIDVAGGPAIAAGDSIWLWSLRPDGSSLVEIDPGTRTATGEYLLDDDPLTVGADEDWWGDAVARRWIGATDDAIWMHERGGSGRQLLTGFDLETHELTDPVGLEGASMSCCIAVDDAIWLPGPEGNLTRFDAATRKVTDTFALGSGIGPGIAAAGAIWLDGDPVHRIDLVTKEVTSIQVTTDGYGLAFGHGSLWAAGEPFVSRIDPETLEINRVARMSHLYDFGPLLSSDGVVWVMREDAAVYPLDLSTVAE